MNHFATLIASIDSPRTKQLLGRYTFINAIILVIVLAATGYLFYVLGSNAYEWNHNIASNLSLIFLTVTLAGFWTALKASSFQRTLLLQTISPVTIYWLRTLQVLFFVLPVCLVTQGGYLLGYGVSGNFTWDLLVLNILSPLLLVTVLALLSASMVFLVRRISKNYLVRSILLSAMLIAFLYFTIQSTQFAGLVAGIWLSDNLNQHFVLLLAVIAALAFAICLLEALFTSMPVGLKALPRFWQFLASRGVINTYDAPLALINRELLHNLRDAAFQRRLIVYTLVLALFSGIGATLLSEAGNGRMSIFSFSLIIALVASSVSHKAGARSRIFFENNQYLPMKESAITWSFWSASLITMTVVTVFLIGVSLIVANLPWSFLSLQRAVIALTAHLVSFFFGAKSREHHLEHGLNDLVPTIVVLAIAVVPIVYYKTVSTAFTLAVLVLWLLVLTLYLRLKSGKSSL